MFDFFKDMKDSYYQIKQPQKIYKKKTEYKKILINMIVYFMGLIYLVLSISMIGSAFKFKEFDAALVKYFCLSIVDIVGLVCFSINKKQAKLIARVAMTIFVVVNLSTTAI